jgi:uncharacterized Zn finger protein (UPF0148 family)
MDSVLEHRHCPHCGYDIHGLPPDEADGTTLCPECGCAWRLGTDLDGARGSRHPRLILARGPRQEH